MLCSVFPDSRLPVKWLVLVGWTNTRRVANVMLSHNLHTLHTMRSLNRIRKSDSRPSAWVAWMLWAMLKAIAGQYSSYPDITIQRFAAHLQAVSPQIFRYQLVRLSQSEASIGISWPIRAEHDTVLYSSGGNDHFMVLHLKRRWGKDILFNRKFFCKARTLWKIC